MGEAAIDKATVMLKVIVIGEMGTGKTSIIRQYCHGFFSEFYKPTVGVDFASKDIDIDERTRVKLALWDIWGQERFAGLTHVYHQEAVGAFVVFDITRPPTIEIAETWKKEIDGKVFDAKGDPIPVLLLGNKIDKAKECKWERTDEMKEWAQRLGFVGYFETSAKEIINLDESALFLVHYILENGIEPKIDRGAVELEPEPARKKKCC